MDLSFHELIDDRFCSVSSTISLGKRSFSDARLTGIIVLVSDTLIIEVGSSLQRVRGPRSLISGTMVTHLKTVMDNPMVRSLV